MKEEDRVSLTRLAGGAIEERIDLEAAKIFDNIADINTPAEKRRTLTLKLTFFSNADRDQVLMKTDVKLQLESTNSIQTAIALGVDTETGEHIAFELTRQIPGQIDMVGHEQEPPAVIKLVR